MPGMVDLRHISQFIGRYKGQQLHFLHAAAWNPEDGNLEIGQYVLHYANGESRLFKYTCENPLPEIEIETMDFASKLVHSAPMLVTVTVE